MERMKPKNIQLIQFLSQLNKPYLTVADLEKLLDLKNRESLYVTLHRLVNYGVLARLRRGVYQLALRPGDVAGMANLLYTPSYLSFESALARYGILSQIPYTITFATPRRSKRITVGDTVVEFRQLRADLFFGYTLEHRLYVAEPEKALLDNLYLMKRGKASLAWNELRLSGLSPERLQEYAVRFPTYVQTALREVLAHYYN
jgi:predicted transcriptional regulator of viral defense system